MEAVVLHSKGILELSCPTQGKGFRPSAAPLYPNIYQVLPGSKNSLYNCGFSDRDNYLNYAQRLTNITMQTVEAYRVYKT